MTTPRQHLADIFVELSGGSPESPLDSPGLLAALAVRSRELLGVRACSVLAGAGDSTDAAEVYASEEPARELVLDAHLRQQGPGPQCWDTGRPLPRTDLTGLMARQRWPYYAPRALALGHTHVAARPLRGRDRTVGALVLFGSDQEPVTDEGLRLGQSLADIVAIAVLRERELHRSHTRTDQLEHALTSRLAIEQAKGILAARKSLSMDESFAILRGHARSHQRKLAEVAREVVEGRLAL
ncbi:GAF and ANTAR domain-containing protein [Streptomyces flavofungini]|uniref:GAF and ANTAR domain-containing protein n=1 Tax=Streptomyces flavofungini TaxID=68200 RepID=A0ABS0WY69_9ACTN|nr:GAF and ANTAR domain-containing protein [Streptomyces flavofungini]MBJ3805882.1 GAF and ANTAR domain-containing protein [Streptomyces flavofungini]GHC75842.1 transcriptional regulator [Streptomyces flavofungini]